MIKHEVALSLQKGCMLPNRETSSTHTHKRVHTRVHTPTQCIKALTLGKSYLISLRIEMESNVSSLIKVCSMKQRGFT